MSDRESFEDFFEENFNIEYIADGDWNKVDFCGQEFGMGYSPDYEIENFKRICEAVYEYQQSKYEKLLAERDAKIKELKDLFKKSYEEQIMQIKYEIAIEFQSQVKELESKLVKQDKIIKEHSQNVCFIQNNAGTLSTAILNCKWTLETIAKIEGENNE